MDTNEFTVSGSEQREPCREVLTERIYTAFKSLGKEQDNLVILGVVMHVFLNIYESQGAFRMIAGITLHIVYLTVNRAKMSNVGLDTVKAYTIIQMLEIP